MVEIPADAQEFQCQNCGLILTDTAMSLDLCPRCHNGHWQSPPRWRSGPTPNPFEGWKQAKSYRNGPDGKPVRVYPQDV